jgi:hypothetical protein
MGQIFSKNKFLFMKWLTALLMIFTFGFCESVYATIYNGECINEKGKFKNCSLEFTENNSLKITFKSEKDKNLNKEINGDKITELTGGEYAKRHVGASVALGALVAPVFLFLLFAKKKRDQFGIGYLNADGKTQATLVQVEKKYGLGMTASLKAISKLDIDYGPETEKSGKKKEKKEKESEKTAESQKSPESNKSKK